ncbi:MAG: glycosyltransferase family 39 protein, partial [Candidatus Firestonebacteria bacterium]
MDNIIASKKFQIFIILFFASIFLFAKLWEGGLATYDDCFYAQQSKEILQTGDWLTMHYDKKPLFENDPVCLWCMAIMFKFFGVSEYTARFSSALFGVGTILLVFFLGNRLYGGYVGLFSSFFLMTTQYFTKFARHSMLDVTLAFFVTLSILFLVKGVLDNKKYYILFGFFCGIAMLTKNILGFFPLLIAIAYFIGTGRFKEIFNPFFLIGSFLGISLPFSWWIYEYLKNGLEFLDVHFGWIILRRAFVIDKEKSTFLSYFGYIKDLWVIYLPWIPITTYGFFRLL